MLMLACECPDQPSNATSRSRNYRIPSLPQQGDFEPLSRTLTKRVLQLTNPNLSYQECQNLGIGTTNGTAEFLLCMCSKIRNQTSTRAHRPSYQLHGPTHPTEELVIPTRFCNLSVRPDGQSVSPRLVVLAYEVSKNSQHLNMLQSS